MRIADTCFLFALFSGDDAHHERAVLDSETEQLIVIPPEILAETLGLLHLRRGFRGALDAGRWLREDSGAHLGEATFLDQAWEQFRLSRGALSYPDAVVVAWCKASRCSPLTYDDEILKRT